MQPDYSNLLNKNFTANTNVASFLPMSTSSTSATQTPVTVPKAPVSAATPPSGPMDASTLGTQESVQLPETPKLSQYDISAIPTIADIQNSTTPATETQAEKTQTTLSDRLLKLIGAQGGKEQAQQDAEQKAGLPQFQTQLNDINGQIQTLQKESLAIPLQLQNEFSGTGATRGGVAPIEQARLRTNAIQALGLSAIAQTLQGNVALAQQQADKAVALQFEPMQAEIDYLREALQMNEKVLTREEKKRSEDQQIQLNERQRLLDNQKEDKKIVLGWAAEAAKNGAPSLLLSRAQATNSPEEALGILSQYMSDPMLKEQALADLEYTRSQTAVNQANLDKINNPGTGDVPTVKTINGVDMQWNPKTQKWETIGGGTSADPSKTTEQLTFLKDTAQQALDLSNAAGRSGARRTAESWFVGSTDYTKLESVTNTLKVNVLSLMTDPNIKKFFGPQMSNADVLLMTSAGTTLNPESNSPDMMQTEIKRLNDLFSRMQKAVGGGAVRTGTLPNGTVVTENSDGSITDAQGNKYDQSGNKI